MADLVGMSTVKVHMHHAEQRLSLWTARCATASADSVLRLDSEQQHSEWRSCCIACVAEQLKQTTHEPLLLGLVKNSMKADGAQPAAPQQ
ncbi:TPA: hypothetical protein ACH3X1_015992 [Trebouxia sp. C0004]